MLQKLLNWIDYHRGARWARWMVTHNVLNQRDARTVIGLANVSQAYRHGALDALGGREMAR